MYSVFNLWRSERNGQMEREEVEACWGTPRFSLLTSQTSRGAHSLPTHTYTPLIDTSGCTDAGTHHPHRTRPPAATVLMPHTGISTFSSAVPLRRATHNYPTETQLTGKSAEFDRTQLRILGNELPHVGWLHSGGPYVGMNMHVNLSHRQQAAARMPKVSSVRSEALALCWALGGCAAVFRRRGLTGNHADAWVLGALVEDNIDWKAGPLGVFWFLSAANSVIS